LPWIFTLAIPGAPDFPFDEAALLTVSMVMRPILLVT